MKCDLITGFNTVWKTILICHLQCQIQPLYPIFFNPLCAELFSGNISYICIFSQFSTLWQCGILILSSCKTRNIVSNADGLANEGTKASSWYWPDFFPDYSVLSIHYDRHHHLQRGAKCKCIHICIYTFFFLTISGCLRLIHENACLHDDGILEIHMARDYSIKMHPHASPTAA